MKQEGCLEDLKCEKNQFWFEIKQRRFEGSFVYFCYRDDFIKHGMK